MACLCKKCVWQANQAEDDDDLYEHFRVRIWAKSMTLFLWRMITTFETKSKGWGDRLRKWFWNEDTMQGMMKKRKECCSVKKKERKGIRIISWCRPFCWRKAMDGSNRFSPDQEVTYHSLSFFLSILSLFLQEFDKTSYTLTVLVHLDSLPSTTMRENGQQQTTRRMHSFHCKRTRETDERMPWMSSYSSHPPLSCHHHLVLLVWSSSESSPPMILSETVSHHHRILVFSG